LIDEAVSALRAGKPIVLPADTVYGLCATPYREAPVRTLYRLKGRAETEPVALLAAELDMLFECVPELRGRAGTIARALLPGPYTLVLPNPARRFRWLCGTTPEAIGVRVPELPDGAREVLDLVGGRDEREPVRGARPRAPRGRARGDPLGGRRPRRRRRAARDSFDGDRLHRAEAARCPRGSRRLARGARAAQPVVISISL